MVFFKIGDIYYSLNWIHGHSRSSVTNNCLHDLNLFFYFMSRLTARVILPRVIYKWRNQCILVGQDSAL